MQDKYSKGFLRFQSRNEKMEDKMEEQKSVLRIIRMSEVESQEIEWLWYPFIPYGKLTIIQGDPGD